MSWKRIVGFVREGGPSFPGGPVDPSWGVDEGGAPDQGLPPGVPGYPDQGLPGGGGGYPDQGLPGGGRPSHPIKPPGIPVLPVDPSWGIPVGPPSFPGDWVPVDPGFGMPPIFGWRPVDPGFGLDMGGVPTHPIAPSPGSPDQGLPPTSPGAPDQGLPPGVPPLPPTAGQLPSRNPGHWVPVDPGFGVPVRPGCPPCNCHGLKPGQLPAWVWIPEIGPGFGLRPSHPIAPTPAPK